MTVAFERPGAEATSDLQPVAQSSWRTAIALLALAAGVVSIPWSGHVDDVDAQFYRVVTRHMLQDDTWFRLRFLPRLFPTFREHSPFGFWPWAAADRLFGEGSLGPVSALFTLATLMLVLRLGRRLGGEAVAVPAVLVLVATDSFLLIGGRSRLDPLLFLLTTASLLPVLSDTPTARHWAVGATFAALGTLVKGPFGLIPFAAGTAAVALERRSWQWLLAGAGLTLAAALPLGGFLLYQRLAGDRSWWSLYVEAQLLASALGERTRGNRPPWYPLGSLAGRFWPGLPLVFLGLWPVLRRRATPAQTRLAVTTVLVLVALMLPHRKVWNHGLIAYPLLGLLAGFGVAPWVRRIARQRPELRPWGLRTLGILAAVAWAFSLLGAGRWFFQPCLVANEFAPALGRLAPHDRVAVLAQLEPWGMISIVATETPLDPEPATQPDWSVVTGPRAMLVRDDTPVGPPPSPWHVEGVARGWTLLLR
jgi:4-amino-4-deoxy-L-arabinose transferase-like glycosyltransferase